MVVGEIMKQGCKKVEVGTASYGTNCEPGYGPGTQPIGGGLPLKKKKRKAPTAKHSIHNLFT